MAPGSTMLLLLIPLILWRLYARARRHMGRQKSRAARHWAAAIFFPMVLLLMTVTTWMRPMASAGLAAGVVAGAVLAVWGLRLTTFESTAEGFFYTPNPYIGIALSILLIGRLAYRFVRLSEPGVVAGNSAAADFGRSPLTLLIFATLVSYYAVYAMGLLRERARHGAGAK